MIDLDQLDDQNKEMLLEYLKQEYEKNPDQFQLPKELEGLLKESKQRGVGSNGKREEIDSVKDIKSQEMILEDAVDSSQQIVGGGQDIEDEEGDEIQEDDEEGAEYLDDQHNHRNQMQVEYQEE